MLRIDGDDASARFFGESLYEMPRHDDGFFVCKRQIDSRFEHRLRRKETRASGYAVYRDVGVRLPYEPLDAVRIISRKRKIAAERRSELFGFFAARMRGEGARTETFGHIFNDVERARTDGAGTAQNENLFHRKKIGTP